MRLGRLALLGLLISVVPVLAGCAGMRNQFGMSAADLPTPDGWVTTSQFQAPDELLLWEQAKSFTARQGYRIDDDATSWSKRRIVTTWKTELATTANDGKRRRRFVELNRMPKRPGWWSVRVAVVQQRNEDVKDPLNPLDAKWRLDAPDVEEAQRLAFVIEQRFRDYGPSEDFDAR